MKRLLFLLYFLLFPFYAVIAQNTSNDSISLWRVDVVDGFYEKVIPNAHITIYEKDSTTVLCDSVPKVYWWNKKETDENIRMYGNCRVPLRNEYIFKIEAQGYNTKWVSQKVKKTWYGKYPNFFSLDKQVRLYEEMNYDLGEATVKASRIQFVMKGDTIEYNAAAFRMSQGSMLDNLIRALPGATLDDNGQIKVNGKLVQNLTVNGRNFFSGDPKIALSNLPAYTVNKIRVFHDKGERFKNVEDNRSAAEKENDPLTMDVQLKREYAQGWISNYEVAGGSNLHGGWDTKWLARLFAMRYTNHSSIAFYANANNISESSNPSGKGEWRKTDPSAGEKKTYMGGINLSLEPKSKKVRFYSSLQAQRQETLNRVTSNSESFYSEGNVFSHSISSNKQTSTNLDWKSDLFLSNSVFGVQISPKVYYVHNKEKGLNTSAQMQGMTSTFIDTLYARSRYNYQRIDKWGANVVLNDRYSLELGEKGGWLSYNFSFDYNKTKDKSSWTDAVNYKQHVADDFHENKRTDRPTFDYNYKLGFVYSLPSFIKTKKVGLYLKVAYDYSQNFNSGHQDLQYNNSPLTPSVNDEIEWLLDQKNSYHTTRMERNNSIVPKLSFGWNKFGIDFNSAMLAQHRRINDYRNAEAKGYIHSDFVYNPSLSLYLGNIMSGEGQRISLDGSIRNALPNLNYLLDVRDETDPLVKFYGNSMLKPERTYRSSLRYEYQTTKPAWRYYAVSINYSKIDNSISRSRIYDRATGVTIYKPQNINGNWRSSIFLGVQLNDLPKGLSWNYHFIGAYNHSNEYATEGMIDDAQRILSVNSLSQEHELRVSYRIKNVTIAGKADANWVQMRSVQHTFDKFSYTDFNYGISFSSPLVWGIDFDTDLMVYCRRGYNDASMNTTNWVWNASLSKALGKRKQWVIKANGFDLLHQISTVRRTVNAQGRTETWYNTIPSYATLHIVYRLDMKPKKK